MALTLPFRHSNTPTLCISQQSYYVNYSLTDLVCFFVTIFILKHSFSMAQHQIHNCLIYTQQHIVGHKSVQISCNPPCTSHQSISPFALKLFLFTDAHPDAKAYLFQDPVYVGLYS